MVRVPAGEFIRGTDEEDVEHKADEFGIVKPWFVDEHPMRKIRLPEFKIDRYETTNERYLSFVRATGHRPPPHWNSGVPDEKILKKPVVLVTWDDARAFCRWAGKRLPTEAEWEKASRGEDGRPYPWGSRFETNRANVGGSYGDLLPVGTFESGKSPYGAYDMVGNVWEWVEDWYKPYPGNGYENPNFGEKVRVIRGNSWSTIGHFPPEIHRELVEHHSTTTFRLFARPDSVIADVGFRCAKSR